MRIIASNPDSIGDVVLRQPLYAALREAGHELTLIVRPELVPLMGVIAPGAEVLTLPIDPYHTEVEAGRLKDLLKAIRAVGPEMVLVASYQWTPFEEWLAGALPDVPRAGMSGRVYPGDPRTGVRNESRMTFGVTAQVSEATPELRKNELLCSAVLGRAVQLPRPRLEVTETQRESGRAALRRMGIEPGEYWVACVGHHAHTRVRNWPTANWGRVLSHWAKAYGRRFVLIGTESEAAAGREVLAAMDEDTRRSAVMAEGLDLDTLLGVVSRSTGDVGRDTGPMHMAAAVGKPVVAVFGGGTWPRFVPAAEPSRVLMTGVPCVGCDWICHLPESYCVKTVPVERVMAAVDDIEGGRVRGAEVEVGEVDRMLQARMVAESGRAAREAMFEAARAARERDALALRASEAERATSEAQALRARLQAEQSSSADLKLKIARARTEQDMLSAVVGQSAAESSQAEAEIARLKKRARKLAGRIERIERSKWYRLGGLLGLKLESAGVEEKGAAPSGPATS